MKSLPMAYAIQKKSKGGMLKCAHGGPIYCAEGCYSDGGETGYHGDLMRPVGQDPEYTSAPIVKDGKKKTMGYDENDSNLFIKKAAYGGSIAKSIVAKKMAKGGEIEDEDVEENFIGDEDLASEESDLEFPDKDEDEKGMKTKGILQKILSRKK